MNNAKNENIEYSDLECFINEIIDIISSRRNDDSLFVYNSIPQDLSIINIKEENQNASK